MKKIILLIISLFPLITLSQDETCAFSDGNFYYWVLLTENQTPASDFDKNDFIDLLETNSNISASESLFLENSIIQVSRFLSDFGLSDNPQRSLYINANTFDLDSFLNSLEESITNSYIYCDCVFSDGFFYYYSKLIIDDIPALDFDKDDYIQHIQLNSNISNEDINYLNSTINEVYKTFPSSSQENLLRGLTVVSNSDLLTPFFYDYSQVIEFIEIDCNEPELSINELELSNGIKIFPNPIIDNFVIQVNDGISIDKMIVYDISGKNIMQKNINGSYHISIRDFRLNSGLYFITFTAGTNSITKKVIVK